MPLDHANAADVPGFAAAPPLNGEQQHIKLLCELFAQITKRASVGPDESFFAIGGRGREVLQLASRVRDSAGLELPPRLLFTHPTARQLAAVLPGLPRCQNIRGRRFALQMIRPALASQPYRGVLLCLPQLGGGDDFVTFIGAAAFHDFDVWACRFALRGDDGPDAETWFDAAAELAEWLHVHTDVLRPKAMLGFSMGGYLAWLVDRFLAVKGHPPTPLLNLDGAPVQVYYPRAGARMQLRLPQIGGLPPARMLLLLRDSFGLMSPPVQMHDDWTVMNVQATRLACPTVSHADFVSHGLLRAYDRTMAAFACADMSAPLPPLPHLDGADLDTAGGAAFRLLSGAMPPRPDAVRPLVEAFPLPACETLQKGLLCLAMASGDAELALGWCRRLTQAKPHNRAAAYALVAALSALGQRTEADALAASWCARHPTDQNMRARARTAPQKPSVWEPRPDLVLGSDPSLDFAAGFLASPLRGFIDSVTAVAITGWAQNALFPEQPVALDIVVDGAVVAQTIADRHRADLKAAGLGSGNHSFSVLLASPLTPPQRKLVVARRSSDQAILPRTGAALAALTS